MTVPLLCLLSACSQQDDTQNTSANDSSVASNNTTMSAGYDSSAANQYGGFKSQVAWGGHLVQIIGCNDCHTPKKMTPQGPVPDMSLMLSGHAVKQTCTRCKPQGDGIQRACGNQRFDCVGWSVGHQLCCQSYTRWNRHRQLGLFSI